MKINSNTTNNDLPCFGLYQRPLSEENETNSSSGSCHSSDVTWQEICRTCGSVCSCPHPVSVVLVSAVMMRRSWPNTSLVLFLPVSFTLHCQPNSSVLSWNCESYFCLLILVTKYLSKATRSLQNSDLEKNAKGHLDGQGNKYVCFRKSENLAKIAPFSPYWCSAKCKSTDC